MWKLRVWFIFQMWGCKTPCLLLGLHRHLICRRIVISRIQWCIFGDMYVTFDFFLCTLYNWYIAPWLCLFIWNWHKTFCGGCINVNDASFIQRIVSKYSQVVAKHAATSLETAYVALFIPNWCWYSRNPEAVKVILYHSKHLNKLLYFTLGLLLEFVL